MPRYVVSRELAKWFWPPPPWLSFLPSPDVPPDDLCHTAIGRAMLALTFGFAARLAHVLPLV